MANLCNKRAGRWGSKLALVQKVVGNRVQQRTRQRAQRQQQQHPEPGPGLDPDVPSLAYDHAASHLLYFNATRCVQLRGNALLALWRLVHDTLAAAAAQELQCVDVTDIVVHWWTSGGRAGPRPRRQ